MGIIYQDALVVYAEKRVKQKMRLKILQELE